jgi:hypothetical protein
MDFPAFPARADTRLAGLLLAIPDPVALNFHALIGKAGLEPSLCVPHGGVPDVSPSPLMRRPLSGDRLASGSGL